MGTRVGRSLRLVVAVGGLVAALGFAGTKAKGEATVWALF
jgi:hypothetical protein